MPFDQNTRNRLSRFVSDARTLLTEEFTRQLQLTYGMDPASGELSDPERLSGISDAERQTALLLRETAEHYQPGWIRLAPRARRETLERIVREQAFTVLNRLCALRMAEARGLLIESIAAGYQSRGFQLYARLAGGALGETGDAYRCYLFSLFDEFALDLAVLFDRFSPQGRLFPRETPLLALLDLINHPDIEQLWAEDETIGWIYQYFNSKEERKAMRDASQAPRNSRELAVRNQFFTPRYVVEFLTDNTLGRTWYEMTQGRTDLVERCRYLVRRPNEIFLAPGEVPPPAADQAAHDPDRSQEELLKQPVSIPYRPRKDPRTITMLDPACGSMHFGLYAFDLFERIYEEAWEIEDAHGPTALERAPLDAPLHKTYPDKAAFLRDVPRLIIEHNIHGVDIDPRAVQIAGLSLWLRAQKSWRAQGLKPHERPQIRRSNVVCAEPMPGDSGLLNEFITRHLAASAEDRVVAWMLRQVFEAMQLAGEAGTLLKIEEQITTIVTEAKQQWRREPKPKQQSFLPDEAVQPAQQILSLDTTGLTDETFWERAEARIDAALKDYAAFAEGDGAYRRRLFADDAARGFAFIDLCRKRYDVVLMNPPFGEATGRSKEYLARMFPATKNDLFSVFVERWTLLLVDGGILGSITNKTGFFLQTFEQWRNIISKKPFLLTIASDMGFGVLDTAVVETMVYIIQKPKLYLDEKTIFIRLVYSDNKSENLVFAIKTIKSGIITDLIWIRHINDFQAIPYSPMCYWVSDRFIRLFNTHKPFSPIFGHIYQGIATGDNFRFLRCRWEIPLTESHSISWVTYDKGGASTLWYSDFPLSVWWDQDGREMKANAQQCYGSASRTIKNEHIFFKPGLTYTQVTIKGFFVRVLPAQCIFDMKGPSLIVENDDIYTALGIFCSSPVQSLAKLMTDGRQWHPTNLMRMPYPKLSNEDRMHIRILAKRLVQFAQKELFYTDETNSVFCKPVADRDNIDLDKSEMSKRLDELVAKNFGSSLSEFKELERVFQIYLQSDESEEEEAFIVGNTTSGFLSYCFGIVAGRWDIRFATGERQPPELPDPFAPLPVCPPGMLQNAQGLPATPEDVPGSYPLRISWPGILVDDEGHSEDIVGRVREAIAVIWGERAEAIEQEACEILNLKGLRDYFRKPALFFADHLQRYSKSRRQAPIYWPLSTPSGSYTLWIYYHRLTDQTLYSCVNDFVDPKLAQVRDELARLQNAAHRGQKAEREYERLNDMLQELAEFRTELLRVAAFWKPNLNDGVQITAAPLWRLFQHKPWQKKLKETWEKLEAGEYDWAHLAYSVWPARVREKCRTDKSLAIAHELEALYVEPPAGVKKGRGRVKKAVAEDDDEGLFGDE